MTCFKKEKFSFRLEQDGIVAVISMESMWEGFLLLHRVTWKEAA